MHLFLFALLVVCAAFGGQRLFHLGGLYRLSHETRARLRPHHCQNPEHCQLHALHARVETSHREIRAELYLVALLEALTLFLVFAALIAGR